ncbi:hypothetical protein V1638_04215 [Pseudarthrobacter sp. J64]|uniref:hypothetical protein n=1 Tax=Pseudarthrobacter sp. J64 TaxID=3116485 RepID=UPI002E81ED0E|nr:hypothetical protein [Pseudarthrobacter sp. J64]MEE2568601.1 hypothetical protein [Pseudarthrobacter sp. J64]
MTSIDLGAKATVKWPTAPATGTYALAVTRPDGQLVTPAPAVTGTGGTTQAEFVPTMAGRHLLTWSQTNAAAYTDVLDVWPADPRFLIPVDQVKNGLNLPSNADPVKYEDLRLYLAAATPVIEDITGPLLAGTQTLIGWGGRSTVVLPHLPNQVLSVTVEGQPVAAYVPDLATGIVYAGSRTAVTSFPRGELIVVYTIGDSEIPPNVKLAVRELVRFWWQAGMQGNGSGGGIRSSAPEGEVHTPSGFAVPRRVIELCQANEKIGGFA